MTIVAGFVGEPTAQIPGFAVLGADSEESGGLIKSSVRKIAKIDKEFCTVLVAGAGHGDFIDYAIEQIENELEPHSSRQDIRSTIERIVTEVYSNKIDTYPASQRDELEFELLCALRVPGSPKVDLVRVRRALSLALKVPTTIGIGGYLARYIIATFYTPGLPLYHNTRFAVYLLAQVKKHVTSCGGASQVVWLDGNGETGELWPASVSQHELSTSVVMEGGAKWLFDFVDPMGWGFDLSKVDKVVDDVGKKIKDDLEKFWQRRQDPATSSPSPSPSPEESEPGDVSAP